MRTSHATIDLRRARNVSALSRFTANRYVQPLREGGSLPAIVDTDGGLFVVKFRGAGQGPKALVAELIVGLLAQAIGLPTPELALIDLPDSFGRSEPDPEIQDLLRASHGVNVGLRFLEGAFNFDPAAAGDLITPEFAAATVWLDAFLTNPDRTHRNPNLMIWHRQPWLIDHGAALYAHHNWATVDEVRTRTPFPLIEQHVLLGQSAGLREIDAHASALLTPDLLEGVLRQVPDALLSVDDGVGAAGVADTGSAAEFSAADTAAGSNSPGGAPSDAGAKSSAADVARRRYVVYLTTRLQAPRLWVDEAIAARERVLREPPRHLSARR